MTDALRSLLHAAHLLPPDELAATVADRAGRLGVRETVLSLADYEQTTLLPVPGAVVPVPTAGPGWRGVAGTRRGRWC